MSASATTAMTNVRAFDLIFPDTQVKCSDGWLGKASSAVEVGVDIHPGDRTHRQGIVDHADIEGSCSLTSRDGDPRVVLVNLQSPPPGECRLP
ncbi:hypothetical protein C2E23DRAFT_824363 [Lenzites betulinus]|nr:hypothetical protein C2E23DRAFT_824363 [Lenzites betulinus]